MVYLVHAMDNSVLSFVHLIFAFSFCLSRSLLCFSLSHSIFRKSIHFFICTYIYAYAYIYQRKDDFCLAATASCYIVVALATKELEKLLNIIKYYYYLLNLIM